MSDSFYVNSRVREYEVKFVNDFAKDISGLKNDNLFLVIDEKVYELYSEKIKDFFDDENIIIIKANEGSKTLAKCSELIERLIERNIRKNNIICAIGGGVIEDVVAFVSMILFRGIDWYFYPTTLLAQADSCIGSKSSINFEGYKNLLGSFYPPSKVVIDVNFLKTLPPDEIKSGIGEILHFYLIAGENKLAEKMMNEYENLIKFPEKMEKYILPSLKIKKAVVEEDELDKGKRNIFNYGHTFGHAIESVTSYSINHGQAVTMGMDIANYLSMHLGNIDKDTFEGMHVILNKNIPEFKLTEDNMEAYFKALSKDKKNIGLNLGCILTRGAGKMFKTQVPMDNKLKDLVKSYFKINTYKSRR